jgi:predicted MPP superfamily phosphohydrolase
MSSAIMANVSSILARSAVALGAVGAACVAYGVFIEHEWYRIARYEVPVLPAGAAPLTILHLSDLHFTRKDRRKKAFVEALERPDVAVVTGDMLGEPEGVEPVVEALRSLRGRLASYVVLGSNDYFVPQPVNPFDYILPGRRHVKGQVSRWRDLVAQLEADGWVVLRNHRAELANDGARFEVLGLDDPHIKRADLRVAPRTRPEEFGLAIVHSPDPAPELLALGYRLVLAGHTHGGQVRFPLVGAVLTNGSTPTRFAMGLARFGTSYLHVSPGMGTSKYAPFRFLCRPEATYLDLVPEPDGRNGGLGTIGGSSPAGAHVHWPDRIGT